jgi:murein DD-endopeptidase MepM/ murein hydrolase activator NlpD
VGRRQRDADRIFPGQVLKIRGEAPPAPRTYIVVRGDTFSGIAARFGTTWRVLQQINNILNANKNSGLLKAITRIKGPVGLPALLVAVGGPLDTRGWEDPGHTGGHEAPHLWALPRGLGGMRAGSVQRSAPQVWTLSAARLRYTTPPGGSVGLRRTCGRCARAAGIIVRGKSR